MQIPRATYRLQFNEHFRLADALALVPYLNDLGISHIYASPLFKATPHSTHGYDVCDFNQLNPELGSEEDLQRLADALHARKMGLIADIVPNHMGITSRENTWWWDVLARGQKSPFAAHFDIDWNPADEKLRGKVLVPILGSECEVVLKNREFQVYFENGRHVLGYFEQRLPISPETADGLPTDAAGLQKFNSDLPALDRLIQQQHYQLAFYEHGDARVNYRRFFAVSTLAAVRVEEEKTFEATHGLLREWFQKGLVDGVRVDHPDGLRDPAQYLARLRAMAPNAWIVVEKILEADESLPANWPVQGTTGYDFLNKVNGVFIDGAVEKVFTDLYREVTGEPTDYRALCLEKKRDVINTFLFSELNRLTGLLVAVAEQEGIVGNFTEKDFRESLAEVVASFPIYRSYVVQRTTPDAADVTAIKMAVHLACENRKDLPEEIFALIHALLIEPPGTAGAQDFVARFQQFTGAVMAKGAEDTTFYCFNRFVSQNEVGGDPGKFSVALGKFQGFLQLQNEELPHKQLTTSTHDTKRAEDVRARLNVLSEIPDIWSQTVRRWMEINAAHKENNFPDRNAEYLYYQTLAGAWPISEGRLQAYMEKASREAKQHTGWTKRNAPYESALRKFISETCRNPKFTSDLERFIARISEAAAVNSLGQTLIKLTAPGVPDIYQGCELWDFSLVDPDNRRSVNFVLRKGLMEKLSSMPPEVAWERRVEGVPKMWLIQKTLKLRARLAGFEGFDYQPVFAKGSKSRHVVAFARGGKVIPVVTRFFMKLNREWQDTELELPAGWWRDEFTDEIYDGVVLMDKLLQSFPAALLVRKEEN